MRRALTIMTLGVLAALSAPAALGEPPVERTLVTAVADADQNRVLIRWRTLEGTPRYRFVDVMRRDANGWVRTRLNGDPVGPLTDAAAIQAVFTAPGRADALAWIRESLGEDYATALLRLQGPDAPTEAEAQLTFLPDQNYGAALALGLGWLDETVVYGATYVYEVWGVDEMGSPVERLGRASAVAGSPGALSAPVLDCVEPGDQRADGAAFLRWTDVPDENRYIAGYEVYRRPCTPVTQACPDDMSPGHPESVKVNRYPVLAASAGRVREGLALFAANCSSCHARETLKGKTLEGFRARQHSDVGASPGFFVHDTPPLNALSSDSLAAIFDYVHEFRFRDDGDDTPAGTVEPGCYCYQAVPRDLLGQLGTPSTRKECAVKDLIPPEVPALVRSARVVVSGRETCELSWQRNDDAADGTVTYELLRRQGAVPRNEYLVVDGNVLKLLTTIPQPGSGARVTFVDTSIGAAEAAGLFFYAVRSKDAWGNLSPISGWVPCVPRDIAAPPPPTPLDVACCAAVPGGCEDHRSPEDPWIVQGGDRVVITDPAVCPPRFVYDIPGDAFRVRVSRSFDGVAWYEEKDIVPEPCAAPYTGHYCYTPVFTPVVDQKIWHRLIALDKSGNRSAPSSHFYAILQGRRAPPAPTIFQVVGAPLEGIPNRLIIRFRSLNPGALLGFALYKRHSTPVQIGEPVWVGKGPFVKVFPAANFANQAPDPTDPEQWIVTAGAKTLKRMSEEPPGLPPIGPEYLHYNSVNDTYEIAVDAGDPENIVLSLTAIGWTGREGRWGSETWDGWIANDEQLDWPRFRDRVPIVLTSPPDTSITIEKLHDWSMRLSWSAEPAGCTVEAEYPQPFAVFRRREDAPNWQQISPLFRCRANQGTDPLTFRDRDVEDGTWYRYAVVQLDRRGEFTYLRTSDPVCYDIFEACEGPAPE